MLWPGHQACPLVFIESCQNIRQVGGQFEQVMGDEVVRVLEQFVLSKALRQMIERVRRDDQQEDSADKLE